MTDDQKYTDNSELYYNDGSGWGRMTIDEFNETLDSDEPDTPLWRALRAIRDLPVNVVRWWFEEDEDA